MEATLSNTFNTTLFSSSEHNTINYKIKIQILVTNFFAIILILFHIKNKPINYDAKEKNYRIRVHVKTARKLELSFQKGEKFTAALGCLTIHESGYKYTNYVPFMI